MLRVDCEQNTDEWYGLRAGIPTASAFDKIVTTKGAKSTQSAGYMNKLLAEWLAGKPYSSYQNASMQRGHELEPQARAAFGIITGLDVEQTGIVYKDDTKLVACSPDGLITGSGVQLKCPEAGTHVGYLLANKLPTAYFTQVQGEMWVTDSDYWWFMSYHPDFDPLLIKVERDEKFSKALDTHIGSFIAEMLEKREQLSRRAA